ncbi:uncharacterized protein DS421_18g615050 [Arachis hypogaea]|nr:uncharacterized protein DS421_18g615050 [Arachis hypogaea]
MRRKLLNVHIPDLAHLAEKVRQTELMKKEKEKYRNKQRSKSKPFTRKEKVAYVIMESSEEEIDFEMEVDLAELKKGPLYVCSLLKKLPSNEKSNDSKLKSGKKYSFDISKSDQIFDVLLKDKQLILPEGRTLLSVKDLKGKPYCKFHQATSHSTNSCVRFRDLIQEAIMEGRFKFDDGKKEMKVDVDPFEVDANYVEPCFGVNMVGMSYEFDVVLDDFESQVRSVYPRIGDGLLDFLVQQKIKDRDVSLCPRCNAIFDAEAAVIFEKERKKKELAHREEQARQRQPIRRLKGSSSKTSQENVSTPLSHSQAILGHRAPSQNQYSFYRGRARGYPRERGGRRSFNQNKKLSIETGKELSKGAMPSVHSRIVFPSDGETYPKEIPSRAKMEKGKAIAQSSRIDKNKDVDVDEEYFDESDDDMVGTISIIPTKYLGEYEGDPNEDYDSEDEEAFSFIRIEDEPGKHPDDLVPTNIAVTDFSGTLTPARGLVTLTVKVGSSERNTVFVVVPSRASYNALLGRDWIHGVGAVPSTVHQSVLLWTKEGKLKTVKADSNLYVEQMHIDFRIYNRKLKPLNVDRSLSPYNCEGCYLSSEGLSVKLRYPELGLEPTGWDCLS